jgi:beta-glucosidase
MSDRTFPPGFLWGTATSAHQVEGGNQNNDWSDWERVLGHIHDGTTAGRACAWWEGMAEEDLATAARLGQNAHRLGLEWSRLEPEEGRWDDAAFARYARLLDRMSELGIARMVTLSHCTLPLWMSRAGGWERPESVRWFARFARKCVRELGGRVDFWVTLNEPSATAGAGYALAEWPPGRASLRAGLRALALLLEAHASAYRTMKEELSSARIGIVINTPDIEADRPTAADRAVAAGQDWSFVRVVLRALRTGVLLPPLSLLPRRIPALRGAFDFLGANYYGRYAVRFDPGAADRLFGRHVQQPTVRAAVCDWGQVSPAGLTRQLVRLSNLGVPLYVTENGIPDAIDAERPRFIVDHVAAVHEAIRRGADVRGYFHWSLVDNFEWSEGWTPRFGLLSLDRATQKRTPRPSAGVYAEICRANAIAVGALEAAGGRRLRSV